MNDQPFLHPLMTKSEFVTIRSSSLLLTKTGRGILCILSYVLPKCLSLFNLLACLFEVSNPEEIPGSVVGMGRAESRKEEKVIIRFP